MAPSVIFRNFAPFRSCSSTTWRRANFGKIRASGSRGNRVCACETGDCRVRCLAHEYTRHVCDTSLVWLLPRSSRGSFRLALGCSGFKWSRVGPSRIQLIFHDCSLNYLPLFRSMPFLLVDCSDRFALESKELGSNGNVWKKINLAERIVESSLIVLVVESSSITLPIKSSSIT